MTWQAVYQRSLSDLLAAEKTRRQAVEADRARLVQLLTGLAQRHDGQRLEEMRRQDPGTPEHWSAEEWVDFFSRPPAAQAQTRSWGENGSGHGNNGHRKTKTGDPKRMQDEVRRLETHIEHLQPIGAREPWSGGEGEHATPKAAQRAGGSTTSESTHTPKHPSTRAPEHPAPHAP